MTAEEIKQELRNQSQLQFPDYSCKNKEGKFINVIDMDIAVKLYAELKEAIEENKKGELKRQEIVKRYLRDSQQLQEAEKQKRFEI